MTMVSMTLHAGSRQAGRQCLVLFATLTFLLLAISSLTCGDVGFGGILGLAPFPNAVGSATLEVGVLGKPDRAIAVPLLVEMTLVEVKGLPLGMGCPTGGLFCVEISSVTSS